MMWWIYKLKNSVAMMILSSYIRLQINDMELSSFVRLLFFCFFFRQNVSPFATITTHRNSFVMNMIQAA